jgi:alkylhydroperoxidase family enzyme
MANRPAATVRLVEESEATDRVAAVFADIKATKRIDFVPAFWRTLASSPDLLESTWSRLKAVMHPEALGHLTQLDPLTREIIALAVSATNGCPYCV